MLSLPKKPINCWITRDSRCKEHWRIYICLTWGFILFALLANLWFYLLARNPLNLIVYCLRPPWSEVYCIKRVESRNSPQDQHTRRITNVWVICRQQQQPKDVDRQQKSLYNFYRAELAPSGGILIDWLIDWQIILSWLLYRLTVVRKSSRVRSPSSYCKSKHFERKRAGAEKKAAKEIVFCKLKSLRDDSSPLSICNKEKLGFTRL